MGNWRLWAAAIAIHGATFVVARISNDVIVAWMFGSLGATLYAMLPLGQRRPE